MKLTLQNTLVVFLTSLILWACEQKKTRADVDSDPANDTTQATHPKANTLAKGTLEVVAELDINPGNVAVSKKGRVFASVHPMRPNKLQLIEITGKKTYEAFPNQQVQSLPKAKNDDQLDTPLGVLVDNQDRLWVIDAGLNLGKTRLFAFDIDTRKELMRFDIPQELAPKNSFVQDLAVDENHGFVYLADFGNPGIIVVDIKQKKYSKFTHLPSMQAEDVDMVIDGKKQLFNGAPARIGINPITLSADRETVYYGPMSGTKWYKIPAKLLRENKKKEEIMAAIETEGPKPLSDGVATNAEGAHYFTNIQNGSIDLLSGGKLSTLVKDDKIVWPDNVRFGNDDWLYIAVNQLHKSPAFTGDKDEASLPFYILRVKTK